jgi:hypothetical protein
MSISKVSPAKPNAAFAASMSSAQTFGGGIGTGGLMSVPALSTTHPHEKLSRRMRYL